MVRCRICRPPYEQREIYDPHKLTAAHNTLPLGTEVEVTNLLNGLSVVVKINDRGPFAQDRIIDLSEAAARILEMQYLGVVPVRVKVLGQQDAHPFAPVAINNNWNSQHLPQPIPNQTLPPMQPVSMQPVSMQPGAPMQQPSGLRVMGLAGLQGNQVVARNFAIGERLLLTSQTSGQVVEVVVINNQLPTSQQVDLLVSDDLLNYLGHQLSILGRF
ncbi:MAG: septal ring lytic transglycosylase RlpA family protein [Deinococcales bacterium]